MSEKERFLEAWRGEWPITKKVMAAIPDSGLNWRPHEKSKNTAELMWVMVNEFEFMVNEVMRGSLDWSKMFPMPPGLSVSGIVSKFEEVAKKVESAVSNATEENLNMLIKFPVSPKEMKDFRVIDIMWMWLMDMIHHRGQLSVYIRPAGGKVPSIYGPSADEPWE